MSSEAPIGLTIMEKLMGLIMIVVGAITFYVTYTNFSSSSVPVLFIGVGTILIFLGILLVIAKTGE